LPLGYDEYIAAENPKIWVISCIPTKSTCWNPYWSNFK